MRDTVKSASYAARATDESVTYLRIYADAEGETHMEEVELALLPRAFFKGHPPLRLTDTLAATGPGWWRVWGNGPTAGSRARPIGATLQDLDGATRCNRSAKLDGHNRRDAVQQSHLRACSSIAA